MASYKSFGAHSCIFVLFFLLSPAHSYLSVIRNFNETRVPHFHVYWNVQTDICQGLGVDFELALARFGITHNRNAHFRGNQINLLYDPGLFPVMKKEKGSNKAKKENGGIPQKGNLEKHLKKFQEDIDKFVPKNFSGLGIIDFEVWRPIFRQNWNSQVVYRNMSIDDVQERHKNEHFAYKDLAQAAKIEFEEAAKAFMLETLKEAHNLRPRARWGYYGFPYCYNFRGKEMNPACPSIAVKENNKSLWLFKESGALYPSLYLTEGRELNQNIQFMIGVLNEAFRVSEMSGFPQIYPYISPFNLKDEFVTNEEMFYSLVVPAYYQAGGVIIWAKSAAVNNYEKCEEMLQYVVKILGPLLDTVRENRYIIDRCFEIPFRYTENVAEDHWQKLYETFELSISPQS